MTRSKAVSLTIGAKRLTAISILILVLSATGISYASFLTGYLSEGVTFPLQVQASTASPSGAVKEFFNPGETVVINAVVSNPTNYQDPYSQYSSYFDYLDYKDPVPIPYKVIFTLEDEFNTPLYMADVDTFIKTGTGRETSITYFVDPLMPSGNYTICVYTWSEWLHEGAALSESGEEIYIQIGES